MKRVELSTCLRMLRESYTDLALQYGVSSLGIFGSVARGHNHPYSDVDILVSFHEIPSLFTIVRLEEHLSNIIGYQVDLVLECSLIADIQDRVLKEVIKI